MRYLSWEAIRDLCDADSLPWTIVGDFNEIVHADEKQDGRRRRENQMRGFREVIGYADLIDLGYVGSRFTWSNIHTKIRLDHALATSTWSDIFPSSRVSILPPFISDHSPLLLQASVNPIVCIKGYHRFRFESFWLQHPECEPLVRAQWLTMGQGQPLFAITKKIEKTSKALDKW
jgi:hypothetical protein